MLIMIRKHLAVAAILSLLTVNAQATPQQCPARVAKLNERDIEIARVAWKYFENNTQPSTGLVNSAHKYPSVTLWDTGSALAGFITAEAMGFISQERFDALTSQLLQTLLELDQFNGEAPNKVYHTKTAEKVNYINKPSENGIGISTLDLGRIVSWLNILSCMHPKYADISQRILESWSYCRLIEHGQMYGMAWDKNKNAAKLMQEGRLGYEQYAGKAFKLLGFDQSLSAHYNNMYATSTVINDVEIVVDSRDAHTLDAHNYVVAESYAMDYFEHGADEENTPLLEAIYDVQKRRWQETGQVTAVSEDNLDRKPYFVYNTIFSDEVPWATITDKGEDMSHLRTLSTKAAISMAYVYPEREYSKVLLDTVWNARNPKGGWYSGIYEDKSLGFNKATTANTNGVIMSIMLSKMYGALNRVCSQCKKGVKLSDEFMTYNNNKKQCLADVPKRIAQGKKHSQALKEKRRLTKEKQKNISPKTNTKRSQTVTVNSIWSVYGKVKHAEKLHQAGKSKQAADTLKALKKTIWTFGDRFPSEQKTFRGLMSTIDTTVKQWKSGKKDANSKTIQTKIKQAALRLQKKTK